MLETSLPEIPDLDTVDQAIIDIVDSPEEMVNIIWVLIGIADDGLKKANKEADYESATKWVELEKQLRAIVDP